MNRALIMRQNYRLFLVAPKNDLKLILFCNLFHRHSSRNLKPSSYSRIKLHSNTFSSTSKHIIVYFNTSATTPIPIHAIRYHIHRGCIMKSNFVHTTAAIPTTSNVMSVLLTTPQRSSKHFMPPISSVEIFEQVGSYVSFVSCWRIVHTYLQISLFFFSSLYIILLYE